MKRPRVLLAEDDDSSRRALAQSLRGCGVDVDELTDGGRLLVSITAQYKDGHRPDEIDLIVSDIQMPICSGLQILRGVRSAHWATPVLLLTAHPTAEASETAEKLGATLMLKPIDLEVFERTVLDLVARRRGG